MSKTKWRRFKKNIAYGCDLCNKRATFYRQDPKKPAWRCTTHKPKSKQTRKNKWIQKAVKKKNRGALHRQLKIPIGKKIPLTLLRRVVRSPKSSKLLKQRAQFAINVRKTRKRSRTR